MIETCLPTDELIDNYLAADVAKETGDAAASFSNMRAITAELEARGVCPRDLSAPTWYAEATDDRRGIC